MTVQVVCCQLESGGAFKIGVLDPIRKIVRVLWCPKWAIKGDCYHGKRNFDLELAHSLCHKEGWEWLVDLERLQFTEEYG